MKAQKNKPFRILKIIVAGVALVLAIPFCMGMYVGITSHTGTTGAITKTIKNNCNCAAVEVDLTAYGLQFSRTDGLTGEKAAYILKECTINGNIATEAARLNKLLLHEVAGYKELDIVELHFKNDNNIETVTFKNGILLQK